MTKDNLIKSPRVRHGLILILSILICIGCQRNVYEKPIESNILVSIEENSGNYQINAETVKEYPCVNYSIEYSKRVIGSLIHIKFKYIPEIDVCLTAIGPAKTTINLGKLEKESYKIQFKLNGKTTEGSLTTNTPLELNLPEGSNVKVD